MSRNNDRVHYSIGTLLAMREVEARKYYCLYAGYYLSMRYERGESEVASEMEAFEQALYDEKRHIEEIGYFIGGCLVGGCDAFVRRNKRESAIEIYTASGEQYVKLLKGDRLFPKHLSGEELSNAIDEGKQAALHFIQATSSSKENRNPSCHR